MSGAPMAATALVAVLLQWLMLAELSVAERGAQNGGGVSINRHVLLDPKNGTPEEPEPLSNGRLTANIDQLEVEKVALEKDLADKLTRLIKARKDRDDLKDDLRNVTRVLRNLKKEELKNRLMMEKASDGMVNISAQYEAQVHAANVALSCLAGTCSAEDLKLWDAWACKGEPQPEALTTMDPALDTTTPEVTTSSEFVGSPQNPQNPEFVVDEQMAVSDTVTTTTTPAPSSTFANDLDGDMADTLKDTVKNKTKGPNVKIFVGDKKVVEVNTSDVTPGMKVGITVHGNEGGTDGVNVTVKGTGGAGSKEDNDTLPVDAYMTTTTAADAEGEAPGDAETETTSTAGTTSKAAGAAGATTTSTTSPTSSKPKASPKFQGKWKQVLEGKELVETIGKDKIIWSNNVTTPITTRSETEIHTKVGGKEFSAKLDGSDKLVWSDGDIWLRVV